MSRRRDVSRIADVATGRGGAAAALVSVGADVDRGRRARVQQVIGRYDGCDGRRACADGGAACLQAQVGRAQAEADEERICNHRVRVPVVVAGGAVEEKIVGDGAVTTAHADAAAGIGAAGVGIKDVVLHVQGVGGEVPVVVHHAVSGAGAAVGEGVVVDLRAAERGRIESHAAPAGAGQHVVV